MTYLDHAKLALRDVYQLDLLHGDGLAGAPIEGLVDSAKCPLAYAITETLQYA